MALGHARHGRRSRHGQQSPRRSHDKNTVPKYCPKILLLYKDMKDASELPPTLTAEIGHFFEQYKANEVGKWAKVSGWRGRDEAEKAISAGHCAERPQSAAKSG